MKRSRWTRKLIVSQLRRLHKSGESLAYAPVARRNQALLSAAAYHFGSYAAAVKAAGLSYARVMQRPRWTRRGVISVIRAARRAGRPLNWGAVIAGGDDLARAAFASVQKRLFGSWSAALAAAGLRDDSVRRYRNWDGETVLRGLRRRRREGRPLNSGAVQRDDPALHAAAIRRFGGFDQALAAAGLKVNKVRLRRRWSKQAVLRDLRRISNGGRLTGAAVRTRDPALYGAAQRLFGSITAALRAAADGADPSAGSA